MYPPRSRIVFVLCLTLSTALLLLSLLWTLDSTSPLHAQSQPDALGSISGFVRNAQGEPLPNVNATLYQADAGPLIRVASTNAQGAYHFSALPPGAYDIRFEDNGNFYAATYYANGSLSSEAETVNVSGNNITGIDVELVAGGVISITVQPSLPITNSSLSLVLFEKNASGRWEVYDWISWPWTDSELVFYGVPNGTYAMCAHPYISPDYPYLSECYDNTLPTSSNAPPDNATEIVVNGANHQTIALKFGDLIQLQGSVKSTTGQPLANIQVQYVDQSGNFSGSDITGVNGHFKFPRLLDSSYTLYLFDGTSNYLPRSETLTVDSSSRYSLTLTLQRAGQITGTISLEGGGRPTSVYVLPLVPLQDGSWDNYNGCACTSIYEPATGAYTVTGMMTGKHRLKVIEWTGTSGSVMGYYGGQDLKSADDIFVTAGETTRNIDVTLGGVGFDGSIRGTVWFSDTRIAGIEVGLFSSYFYEQSILPFVTTTTDAQGNYRFDGLQAALYFVGFRDPNGDYATTFHLDETLQPQPLVITGTTVINKVDGFLTPGSTIRGKVLRPAGRLRGDFRIFVWVAETGGWLPYIDVLTDAQGTFEITGLMPGTYRVGVRSPEYLPPYDIRFYPTGGNETEDSDIVVAENVVISGINIPIDLLPQAYLPLLGGNGQISE